MTDLVNLFANLIGSDSVWPGEPVRLRPATEEQVAKVLAAAAERRLAVAVQGAGTRAHLGYPVRADLVLETLALDRVLEYNAADLTITVQAGLPLQALQRTLAQGWQWLPVDPPHADRCTVGGMVAANASGPRRLLYGSPRDLVLGMRIALTDGTLVRCGGRVVKNVAGYDLNKLFVGSMGTLGVITELTFKVRPLPAGSRTALLGFSSAEAALAVAQAVLHSELLPAALEYLGPEACGVLGVPGPHALAAVLEEVPAAIAYQAARLADLARAGGGQPCADAPGDALTPVVHLAERLQPAAVVKLNLTMAQVLGGVQAARAAAQASGLSAACTARCGSGIVYAHLGGAESDPAAVVRAVDALLDHAAAAGGSATVELAAPAVRDRVALWGRPRPEQFLMEGIKRRFDPQGILNPGRFLVEPNTDRAESGLRIRGTLGLDENKGVQA